MNIFSELKRRNVFKVGVAYLVVAWLIAQVIAVVNEPLNLPDQFDTIVILVLLLGLPVALVIAWAFELTPEGIRATASVAEEDSIRPQTGQKLNKLIISGLSLALVLVIVDAYVLEPGSTADQAAATTVTSSDPLPALLTEIEIPARSIAVLPFTNLSSDPEQEYFSDGLAEELLNKLASVNGLQVAARTSSFYFKDRNEDMRTIGETLGVANILEGSVRKAGNDVRITAQLINAATGFQLWSETYERELADIFAVQDEIAAAVTTALSITLGAGEFDRPGMTRNPQAWDALLRAQAIEREGGIARWDEGLAAIQQAVALDPDFGLAWLQLAGWYGFGEILLPPEATADFPALAAEARTRARAVSPQMPELLQVDAGQAVTSGQWLQADALYQQLLAGNDASAARTNAEYGTMLRWAGRASDALPYLLRARRLDPLQPDIAMGLAVALLQVNRVEESKAEAERGISLGNTTINTFLMAVRMLAAYSEGNAVEAAEWIRAGGAPPGEIYSEVADLQAAGETGAVLEKLRNINSTTAAPLNSVALAVPALLAGDTELAWNFQSRGNPDRVAALGIINTWLDLTSDMRRMPQFKQLVRNTGLLDYWRTTGQWADKCRPTEGNDDFECF